jgi:hypothetical protein
MSKFTLACNILDLCLLPGGSEMYMVGIALVCWANWTIHNKVTFDGYTLKSPIEAAFTMCSFHLYWAGLQANDDKEKVVAGTRKLMKLAADVARRGQRWMLYKIRP